MIRQLKNRNKTLEKGSRKLQHAFVAFQNERDSLGRIIRPRTVKKNDYNIMELFQNLKKSTKQYFFQKEFQKMQNKFNSLKKNLQKQNRDINYDRQVDNCIQIASRLHDKKAQGERKKQKLYINLRQKINKKINVVTQGLKKIRKSNMKNSLNDEQSHYILKQVENSPKSINIELFKSFSARSQIMANFCDRGLKYYCLVDQKKFDPWKTWYKKDNVQVFPGKVIQIKSLQKSIY